MDILVEAKKEYLGQLCTIMCPVMIEVFEEMYKESVTRSNGRRPLIMFQKLLQEVPAWSNALSKQHSDNITRKCAWFSDLLAAVFVSCVKILSSVRLNSENKKLSLKLPTNEVFVQTCYNNAAKDLYKDPYIYHEEQSEYVRDDKLTQRFVTCIENTVKELLPVQQILQTYMSQLQPETETEVDEGVVETVDPEVFEGEEAPAPMDPAEPAEPAELGAPLEAPPPTEGDPAAMEQAEAFANEFKTISTGEPKYAQAPAPAPAPTLFDDAPEQRTKKLMY